MLIDDDRAFSFLNSLQEQLEGYKKLQEISQVQSRAIEEQKEEGLLELLKGKQEVIDRIEALSQEFKEERKGIETVSLGKFSSIDEEIDCVLSAIEDILKDIVESESRDMEMLKSHQEDGREKMQKLGKGKKIAKAYRASGGNSKVSREG